jgi:hypothetical protein
LYLDNSAGTYFFSIGGLDGAALYMNANVGQQWQYLGTTVATLGTYYDGSDFSSVGIIGRTNGTIPLAIVGKSGQTADLLRIKQHTAGNYFLQMKSTGNLLLQNGGTFTDSGERLQVTGTMKVTGNTTLTNVTCTSLDCPSYGSQGATSGTKFNINPSNAFSGTTGTVILLGVSHTSGGGFIPTSGNATHNMLVLSSTINQTGTANGITRGLYVNPTLTAAADFRAIEWSNNTGWGLYGAGTAANYMAGNLLLGSTTNSGERLQVTGNVKVTGNVAVDTNTFFVDTTNKRIGVRTATPGAGIDLWNNTATDEVAQYRISDNRVTIPNYSSVGYNPNITTNTLGYYAPFSGSTGGLAFVGFTSNTNTGTPFAFIGHHGGTAPTTATLKFTGWKHNGSTGRTALTGSEIIAGFNSGTNADVFQVKANGRINMSSLPTSPTGLSSGDLWNNLGMINIV